MPMLVSTYGLVSHTVRQYHVDFQTVHSDLFPPLFLFEYTRPFHNSPFSK